MTESNRHPRSVQPHRPGTVSVPVLFALRNVQPNIVGGIANSPKTSAGISIPPTERSNARVDSTTPITAPSMPTAQPVPTPLPVPKTAAPHSNRSFNVVVGLLVIALCLLVIRNSQGSKTGSNATIASTPATIQTGSKAESNSIATPTLSNTTPSNSPTTSVKVDPFPSLPTPQLQSFAEQKKSEDKPLELGSSETQMQIPLTNSVASQGTNDTLLNQASKDPISLGGNPFSGMDSGASSGQNMVQAKPTLLLPSAKSETAPATNPTFSFPETRVAMNPVSGSTSPSVPNSLNSLELTGPSNSPPSNTTAQNAEASTAIVDTVYPSLTTRELIDLRNRSSQATPANAFNGQPYPMTSTTPSVPASPISVSTPVGPGNAPPNNLAPYQPIPKTNSPSAYQPLPTEGTMFSGKAYPPLPQENPAVKVPPYEQGAWNAAQPSLPIRQPAPGSSNRYPTTLSPQVPYTPVAPTQAGIPFGYPPGR